MKKCFSLIELLVVITVLMILATLLQPSLQKITKNANRALCLNSKKSFAVGAFIYAEEHDNFLPNLGTSLIHHADTRNIDYFEKYLNDRDDVECPNFQLGLHRSRVGNVDIGSVYLAHKSSSRYPSLRSDSNESIWGKRWVSPKRVTDDSEITLFACRVEYSESRWTGKFPHTRDKEDWQPYPVGLNVDQVNWEGGSSGYLDGSANWVHRNDQDWHLTSRTTKTKFFFPTRKK